MRRIGVGVIGTGFWGENQVRVLRQSPIADLVAICEKDEKRAKEIGTKYGVPWYPDLSKFLRLPSLDAVTICTPTQSHLKVGSLAIEAGKNLLVEKPMTGEERAAEKLVKSAKKAGVKLLVGFIERFNPGVRAVKRLLDQQTVGDVIIATGRRVARWPIRIGDVGVIKDTAIHDIDAMRYLFEEEVSAIFAQTGSLRTRAYEDYAEMMLRFNRGTTGFIDANWLTPRKVRTLIITGSDATINLDYITQEITVENSERLVKPYTPWAEPLKVELENFIKTILKDSREAPSGEDAIRAIRICDAALRSGRSKTLVRLNAN
jgi:UDP-N-acetylglucosamine 3-dehydrogenase